MLPKDRQKAVVEVTTRVTESVLARSAASREAYLDNVIHEVLYHEKRRVDAHPDAVNARQDRIWLREARARFRRGSEQEKKKLLREIVGRYAGEVVGHFSEPVYNLATHVLPTGLGVILNAVSPLKLIKRFPRLPDVADHIVIQGDTDHIRALQNIGTTIFVPTHASNLDSVAIGYSFFKAGLPPVIYGAGINLFTNKLFGFFMNRLGAYKVDRLKSSGLYKEVLKEYAIVTLELGYPNLFFPGGTRSRSGAVEQKLKLGLMGCGLKAYFNNLKRGGPRPRLFIVPCTINYQLVLEAETLIEDHLKEAGKSRFIIDDDEFSMPGRIYSFLKNLVSLDASVYIRFSRPLDPFGNPVDADGESLDGRGRRIDISRYLYGNGELTEDPQRDVEYTRQLGEAVVDAYMRDSVIFSPHILAWTAFELIAERKPDPDFYRFLRETAYEGSIPMVEFYRAVERTLARVRKLEEQGRIRLASTPASGDVDAVVEKGLKLFGSYHSRPALKRRGDRLFPEDVNLLYYYRNRLWGYDLERLD